MRRKIRSGIGMLLSVSMVFSTVAIISEIKAEYQPQVLAAEGENSGTSTEGGTVVAATGTGYTDEATGYTYSLYTESTDSGTSVQKAEITGYTGTDWNLVIPASVTKEGTSIPVGSIGDSAFAGNANITGVTISEGVEKMGVKAFYKCMNLTSVSIPSTIKKWTPSTAGYEKRFNYAFGNCSKLKNLTFAEGLDLIGGNAFDGCTALESVEIPAPAAVGQGAFIGCTALRNLELKEGVKEICSKAFEGCTALTEVIIPSTVEFKTEIKDNNDSVTGGAFRDCTSLLKVVLKEGIQSLERSNPFPGCTSLKSITVPNSVEDISYAFYECECLEEIILPENLKIIGKHAFDGCAALKEITIPSTVTEVDEFAFANCSSLKTLTFPAGCNNFTGNAVSVGGSQLESIYLLSEDLGDCTVQGLIFYMGLSSDGKVYCLDGSGTYEKLYRRFELDHKLPQLATLTPDLIVTVEGYQEVYDTKPHPAVTLSGTESDDQISYCMVEEDGTRGETLQESPEITEPGTYTVEVTLVRNEIRYRQKVTVEIAKRTPVLQIPDQKVYEKEDWVPAADTQDYDGEPEYTYYRDETLKKKCSGKPSAPGVYYVKAALAENAHYLSGESNVAKIEVLEGSAPVTNPGTDQNTNPGTNQSTNSGTGTNTKPGGSSSVTNPSPNPGTSKKVSVKKVTIKKVKSPKKKTMQVQWKKVSGVTGYEIYIGTNKKMTKGKKIYTVKKAKTVKKVIKKLKSKKKYYVKVRAYKTVSGKKHNGKFSSVKSVRIK